MKIINLLPKEKQLEQQYRKAFQMLVSLIWLTALTFAAVLLVQFGVKAFLGSEESKLNASIASLKELTGKAENAKLKARVEELNNLVIDYQALSTGIPKISKVVRAFAPLVPESIRVNSMKVDSVKKTVDITGFSPTRELVIELYDNVVAEAKDFPNIDYPLENVAKPIDINFHFTFNIADPLLK